MSGLQEEGMAGARCRRSVDGVEVVALRVNVLQGKDAGSGWDWASYQVGTCDGVTEVFKERRVAEGLGREIGRAQGHGRPLSLIYFDIDHFKRINDRHGHLCGDYVLQQIVRLVRPALRPEQVFARVGGEEFALLSPEMSTDGAAHLAEKLRSQFEQELFEYADVELRITCSFGIAGLQPGMDRDGLYHAADQAMYRSKNGGRNRVTVADESPSEG